MDDLRRAAVPLTPEVAAVVACDSRLDPAPATAAAVRATEMSVKATRMRSAKLTVTYESIVCFG